MWPFDDMISDTMALRCGVIRSPLERSNSSTDWSVGAIAAFYRCCNTLQKLWDAKHGRASPRRRKGRRFLPPSMVVVLFAAVLVHRLVHHGQHLWPACGEESPDQRCGQHQEDDVQDRRV